jgi:hypothetical protein
MARREASSRQVAGDGGRQGRQQTADRADRADSQERSGSSRDRQQTWPKQQPGGVEQGAGRAGGGARWSRSAELLNCWVARVEAVEQATATATATATRFVTCQRAAAKCSSRHVPSYAHLCLPLPTHCATTPATPDCAALHSSAAAAIYLPAPASQHPVPMAVSHDCSLTLAPCSPACCCR